MKANLVELLESWRDRLISTDPGLSRLRTGVTALVGVGTTIGLEYAFSPLSGEPSLIAMMLGAIVGMLAAMGVSDPTPAGKALTLVLFPVAISPGLVAGALAGPHHVLSLVLFVAVMFTAVWVRRFGMRFFMYGMLAWMGYFLADLLGATVSQYPHLLSIVAVAVAWALVLNLVVFRDHPDRVLRATGRALRLRVRDVATAATAVLGQPGGRQLRNLRRQTARVREAGLMVDARLAAPGALPPGWPATRLRRVVVDLEIGIHLVALAVTRLSRLELPPALRDAALAQVQALRSAAGPVPAAGQAPGPASPAGEAGDAANAADAAALQVTHLSRAVARVLATEDRWSRAATADGEHDGEPFEPAVTLAGGSLPGSAGTVRDMLSATATAAAPGRGALWARLSLTSRQAIQVGVATALAIAAGEALSGSRYYWAAIAAFIAFTGTSTSAETLTKAASRVTGTLVGLGVAILAAEATAGHTTIAIIVILACIGLGFYLNKVSYALMIFFITIMIAQLYSLLHEFSAGLLVLRLEETAIGAGIGVAVTLVVLPISTQATARSAEGAFLTSLHGLLEAAAARLEAGPGGPGGPDLMGPSRDLDARLQQLALVTEPLTRPLYFGSPYQDARRILTAAQACDLYARGLALVLESAATGAAELSPACRALAGACLTLSGDDQAGRARAAAAAAEIAGRIEALPSAGCPAARYLLRTSEAIEYLARPGRGDSPVSPGATRRIGFSRQGDPPVS